MTNHPRREGPGSHEGRTEVRPDPRARQAALDKVLRQIEELNRRMDAPAAAHPHPPVVPLELGARLSAADGENLTARQKQPRMAAFPDAGASAPIRRRVPPPTASEAMAGVSPVPNAAAPALPRALAAGAGAWQIGPVLGTLGLLPQFVAQVTERLQEQHGSTPPETLHEELALAGELLFSAWRTAPIAAPAADGHPPVHVFVGAPGVGKTTCLCKWLAQSVLLEGRRAQVWRLDGRSANLAENLSLYCEVLGVPVQRGWPGQGQSSADLLFVDWPGVEWRAAEAVAELAGRVQALGNPQVHLVLNAAYDARLWLAQVAAFQGLPIRDVIVTHLDEELRWARLWNLVLGTNCVVAFLSAGQNVPGEFQPATPDRLWPGGTGAIPPNYAPSLPS